MSSWIGPEDVVRAKQQIAQHEAKKRERATRQAKVATEDGSAPNKRRFISFTRVIVRFRK